MRGLNSYLISDERGTDLISQNKEGLFSIFGTVCKSFIQTVCFVLKSEFVYSLEENIIVVQI